MTARFFAPDASVPGDLVTLPVDQAEHLTRVLRLGAGDPVRVFNGRGEEFESIVEVAARDVVRVRVGEPYPSAPEPRVAITLAQAVLKGDKMDDVVRDAVMIGASAIQPVLTARTEVSLAALERGRRRERWERVAVSSAKQCGRSVVPPVKEPVSLASLVQTLGSPLMGPGVMLVEPGASTASIALADLGGGTPTTATAVIGPEGGWTPEEIAMASNGCRLLVLGGRTLRADSMALVALAALYAHWEEF